MLVEIHRRLRSLYVETKILREICNRHPEWKPEQAMIKSLEEQFDSLVEDVILIMVDKQMDILHNKF